MPNCILTGQAITPENDSRAHIIPSALGGRLKPRGILSDDGNAILNDKADLPLIQAFQPIMTLLGGARDRGDNPPTTMTDEAGKAYTFKFNKPLALQRPEFSMEQVDGVVEVKVAARTKKELRTLLGQVKKAHPSFDIEEAVQRASITESHPPGRLRSSLQIGPSVTFPAAFAAASLFAAYSRLQAHPELAAYIARLDPSAEQVLLPPDTFLWEPPAGAVTVSGPEVSHRVILISDAAKRSALFYIEYFNVIGVGVLLPYSEDRTSTYAVDVLSGVSVPLTLDESAMRAASWSPSYQLGEDAFYKRVTERVTHVLAVAHDRGRSAAIGTLVDEALGPIDGRTLTQEDINRLSAKAADFILKQMLRR